MRDQPLSSAAAVAAVAAGFKYIWRIEYANGSVLTQYDDAGVEQKLDFSLPISAASWVPIDPCLHAPKLVLAEGHKLCIFRRVFLSSDGQKHICYGLGSEQNVEGKVQKQIWYLTPSFPLPVTYALCADPSSHEAPGPHVETATLLFPGSFEESGDPDFVCFLQRWLTEIVPVTVAQITREAREAHARASTPREGVRAEG